MKNKFGLITFSQSGSEFRLNGNKLVKNAKKIGFDVAKNLSEKDIKNKKIIKQLNYNLKLGNRGYGFMMWKPYIILDFLNKNNIEYLIYHDAGRSIYNDYSLTFFPKKIIEYIKINKLDFFLGNLIPQYGPMSKWTKRDCFLIMNADKKQIYSKPQIQSSWSVWKNTENSKFFLKLWLKYSLNYRCIANIDNELKKKNYPNFKAHRNDQSIYSILFYKLKYTKKYYFDFSHHLIFIILINFLNKFKKPNLISGQFLKAMDDAELMLSKKYFKIFYKFLSFYINKKIWKK